MVNHHEDRQPAEERMIEAIDNLNQRIQALSTPSQLSPVQFPTFDGDTDPYNFREFLRKWYLVANALSYDDELACRRLPLSLRGQALSVYQTIPPAQKNDWKAMCQELCNKLYSEKCLPRQRSALNRCYQRDNESSYQYGIRVRDLVSIAYPRVKYTEAQIKDLETSHFISGLRPELKGALSRAEVANMDDAMQQASKEEQLQKEIKADRIFQERIVASIHMESRQLELEQKLDALAEKFQDLQLAYNAY